MQLLSQHPSSLLKYKDPSMFLPLVCRKAEVSQASLSHKEQARAVNDQDNRMSPSQCLMHIPELFLTDTTAATTRGEKLTA